MSRSEAKDKRMTPEGEEAKDKEERLKNEKRDEAFRERGPE